MLQFLGMVKAAAVPMDKDAQLFTSKARSYVIVGTNSCFLFLLYTPHYLLSTTLLCLFFPLRRKCSECQLSQGLSSFSSPPPPPVEVILFKVLTLCRGQRCTQTRHLMFHKVFFPPVPGHSCQLLTQHTSFHVTRTMVDYYLKQRVAITPLSALQRQFLTHRLTRKVLDGEIADLKERALIWCDFYSVFGDEAAWASAHTHGN